MKMQCWIQAWNDIRTPEMRWNERIVSITDGQYTNERCVPSTAYGSDTHSVYSVQCSVFRMFAWIHLILMRLLWISLCAGSTHRRAKYDRLAQYQPVNTLGMNSSTYDIFNVIFTYSYDAYVAGNIFIHVWSLLANKKNERKTGMKIPTCYGNVSIWFHAFRNFTK